MLDASQGFRRAAKREEGLALQVQQVLFGDLHGMDELAPTKNIRKAVGDLRVVGRDLFSSAQKVDLPAESGEAVLPHGHNGRGFRRAMIIGEHSRSFLRLEEQTVRMNGDSVSLAQKS